MVGGTWAAVLAGAGYMLVDHQLTLAAIEHGLSVLSPVLAGVAAGGGVHFIWNKTSNGKNGNGGH